MAASNESLIVISDDDFYTVDKVFAVVLADYKRLIRSAKADVLIHPQDARFYTRDIMHWSPIVSAIRRVRRRLSPESGVIDRCKQRMYAKTK